MRIVITGATGHMGRALAAAAEAAGVEVAAFVSPEYPAPDETHCLRPADYKGTADALVDFSHHLATNELMAYCEENNLPAVICATGQTPEEEARIAAAAEKIPVFRSANMSLGVAFLRKVAAEAAALFPEADIEICEIHHHRKLDVPSGTALALGNAICAARPGARLNVGRHENGRRSPEEIGIHSLRMGDQVGTHTVYVDTGRETLALTHKANDRALFADGALKAAAFLVGKAPGLYGMDELLAAL